jgi:hypothetical protein
MVTIEVETLIEHRESSPENTANRASVIAKEMMAGLGSLSPLVMRQESDHP